MICDFLKSTVTDIILKVGITMQMDCGRTFEESFYSVRDRFKLDVKIEKASYIMWGKDWHKQKQNKKTKK